MTYDSRPLEERFDGYSAEMLRKAGITSPIVGYDDDPNMTFERKYGIGAQDPDIVPERVGVEIHESCLADAGEAFVHMVREATEMRRRAYDYQFGDFEVKSWATSWK